MSAAGAHPDLSTDEELVAYLDGELAPEARRHIEARLAADAELRRQLQTLDKTWGALDELPHTTVDDDFARTTIEMVAVAAEHDAGARAADETRSRRRHELRLAVFGIAAAALGFVGFRALVSDGNQALLDQLPVIVQVDVLGQFHDVDFLRRLRERVPVEELADDREVLAEELAELQQAALPSREQRRAWVEQLSPDEKAALAAKANRFRALSPAPEAQWQLAERERQIARSGDAAQLQETMVAYAQWLARRPAGEQAELRQLPADQRLARIEQTVRREDRWIAQQLSSSDAAQLRKTALAIGDERREAFEEFFAQRRGRGRAGGSRRIDPRWVAMGIVFHDLRDDQTRDATRERLTSALGPAARSTLESLRRRQDEQLLRWVRDALWPKRGPEELEQFFATELDNEQLERLLSMPTADMETELERLYVEEELGLPGVQWLDGFGEPGRFGRGMRGGDDRPRDQGFRDRPPRGEENGPPPGEGNGPPRGPDMRGPDMNGPQGRPPVDRPPPAEGQANPFGPPLPEHRQ